MVEPNLLILIILLLFGYTILYFGGRKYLENFSNEKTTYSPITPPEMPYSMKPIDNVDDYEYSSVFQNTGSKEASKKQYSDAMTRYPMDWSVQGPNSQYFQENQSKYEEKPLENKEDALLPDSATLDDEERKILQTYVPETSKGLLEYSVDDVKTLIERVYIRKGLIPVIEKSKQGQNVWEITEVKEKNPHIVWEDETEREMMTKRGEEVIEVPYTASDVAAGLDPYYQARQVVRDGKNQFTPGLERMFAPTYPIKEWY